MKHEAKEGTVRWIPGVGVFSSDGIECRSVDSWDADVMAYLLAENRALKALLDEAQRQNAEALEAYEASVEIGFLKAEKQALEAQLEDLQERQYAALAWIVESIHKTARGDEPGASS